MLTHGHEDHIGAVPFLLREKPDIPLVGSRLTLALVEAKLVEHRIDAYQLEVAEGRTETVRPVRGASSSPSTTRSPTLWRSRSAPPAGAGAAHRRLQDGPAAARRTAHRPERLRPARRRRRRPVHGRLDQRRGAGVHAARARHRAGARPGLRRGAAPDHRRVVRQPRPPGPAGARRGRRAPAQGRLRRPVDGAQHGHRS